MDKSLRAPPTRKEPEIWTLETLNRLRVEVGRTKKNLMRWKIGEIAEYECGDVQDN